MEWEWCRKVRLSRNWFVHWVILRECEIKFSHVWSCFAFPIENEKNTLNERTYPLFLLQASLCICSCWWARLCMHLKKTEGLRAMLLLMMLTQTQAEPYSLSHLGLCAIDVCRFFEVRRHHRTPHDIITIKNIHKHCFSQNHQWWDDNHDNKRPEHANLRSKWTMRAHNYICA